jgi:phosphoribosylaminoimidazolecarboxamide formyltransferase / IMP cyclohydrolase
VTDSWGADTRVAVLATADKSGIVEFGRGLRRLGWELYATTGTLRLLREHDVHADSVGVLTNSAEHFGGRAKTLTASVFDGLLLRHDVEEDVAYARQHGVRPIELVACTFTPPGAYPGAVETVDIGGPAMVRAAAKNHRFVLPLVDPADYPAVLDELAAGGVSGPRRTLLAAKAFRATEHYDRTVANLLFG